MKTRSKKAAGPRAPSLHRFALPCCCCCREVGGEVRYQGRCLSMYVSRLGMKVGVLEVRYQGRYVYICVVACCGQWLACIRRCTRSWHLASGTGSGLMPLPPFAQRAALHQARVRFPLRSWRPRARPPPRPWRRAKGKVPQALPVPVPQALPVPVPQALPVVPVPQALPVVPVPQALSLCRSSAGA